jgi:hypothetical protein
MAHAGQFSNKKGEFDHSIKKAVYAWIQRNKKGL